MASVSGAGTRTAGNMQRPHLTSVRGITSVDFQLQLLDSRLGSRQQVSQLCYMLGVLRRERNPRRTARRSGGSTHAV